MLFICTEKNGILYTYKQQKLNDEDGSSIGVHQMEVQRAVNVGQNCFPAPYNTDEHTTTLFHDNWCHLTCFLSLLWLEQQNWQTLPLHQGIEQRGH